MKKRIFIVAALLLILIAGLAILAGRIQTEPRLEGRFLSEWITDLILRRDAAHARLVLQNSGTNQVPLLVRWATETEPARPSFKRQFMRQYNQDINWLRTRGVTNAQYLRPSRSAPEFDHQTLGQAALPELSPAGKTAAVQRLILLMTGTNEDIAGSACYALSKMAPESIEPLLALLAGNDDDDRETAATALAMMGTNAAPAIPALKKLLSDPRLTVRIQAATALNELGADPTSLLPAMLQGIAGLKDPDALYANIQDAMQKFSKLASGHGTNVAGK